MTPVAYGRALRHERVRVPTVVPGLARVAVFVGAWWTFLSVVTRA